MVAGAPVCPEVCDYISLALVQLEFGQGFVCEPIPPDGGHEFAAAVRSPFSQLGRLLLWLLDTLGGNKFRSGATFCDGEPLA